MRYVAFPIVFLCGIFMSGFLSAQTKDLSILASGEFLSFRAILDAEEDLFGYIVCYERDQLSEKAKKVECYVLDKNLNELAQKLFNAEIEVEGYYPYFNHKNELILYPLTTEDQREDKAFVFPSSRKWDLNSNKVSVYHHLCFEDELVTPCKRNKSKSQLDDERNDHIREHGYAPKEQIRILEDSSIIANSWEEHYYNNRLSYISNVNFYKYDKSGKPLWISPLSEEGKKEDFIYGRMLYASTDYVYFMARHYYEYEIASIFLIGIDSRSGQRVLLEDVSKQFDYFNVHSGLPEVIEEVGDQVHLIGVKKNAVEDQLGYYSIVIDKKTQSISGRFMGFESLKSDLKKINKYGKTSKGYFLTLRNAFVHEDGSSVLITEKYKNRGLAFKDKKQKTRDFVVIMFDEQFNKRSAQLIEKDKSKSPYSDLIYTQYIDGKKGSAFFYQDYRQDDESKDKNWILGINTIIDGEFMNEEIQMSSDDFFLAPYRAKEGYILLREYNKESKHNQIRLERLNF